MRRSRGAGGQRGYRGSASFVLTAPVAAVLNFIPVLGPFLAPFKFQAAALAGLRWEPIFDLCYA